MGVGETMSAPRLAIGLGCRSGVSPDSVMALIEDACLRVEGEVIALYTAGEKQAELALDEAARRLRLPLVFLPRSLLKAAAPKAVSVSVRVLARFSVPSIAETAALAGAGPGARLVLPRISADGVTCAIASCAPASSLE